MFKTLRTNRNEIIAYPIVLLLVFSGLYYGKTYFPPLAYLLTFFYFIAIVAFVCFSPWLVIRITLPNTMGKFINEWFDAGWRALGTPSDYKFNKAGRKSEEGEEYQYSGHLQRTFLFTIAVYSVMVIANSIIALAAFSQGISIPVLGG